MIVNNKQRYFKNVIIFNQYVNNIDNNMIINYYIQILIKNIIILQISL